MKDKEPNPKDPKPISDFLGRLENAAAEGATRPDQLPAKKAKEWQKPLAKCGYPARHIGQLAEGITGTSAEVAAKLWKKVSTGDCLLLLLGTRGAGKTLMATEWARRRIVEQDEAPGRYVKCADLIADIKATWHTGGQTIGTEQDVLRKYRATKFLVIDEFHEKGASEWEARTLVNLLDHRYDDMLATVLIANLSPEEVGNHINQSIIDRANETGGMIFCDWPSRRTK